MMINFVVSDIHSFYSIFKKALDEKGFDINNENHRLIICGDLFDRGKEAKELLNFLLSIPENRLIIVKGNHEDLIEDCLEELYNYSNISGHHITNGTLDTIAQLTNYNIYDLLLGDYKADVIKSKLTNYFNLIKRAVNYYEINNYIFVHGWIPLIREYEDLKTGDDISWKSARWSNGMEDWNAGRKYPGKTIVCGHWHTSWGHSRLHNNGSEFGEDACFDPFIDEGIIALDGCIAYSKQCNVLVIEEK